MEENTHQIAKNKVAYLIKLEDSINQALIPNRTAISIIKLGQKLSPGVSLTKIKQGSAKIRNKAAVS
tara:strand:- start:61 stop:261 length:201 start_codon:yes stop_codon:yes gene_type:complete